MLKQSKGWNYRQEKRQNFRFFRLAHGLTNKAVPEKWGGECE